MRKQVSTGSHLGYGEDFSFFFPRLTWIWQRMLQWTKASVRWSNRSAVVTCEHASSTSLSTHLQLMSGDMESEESGRYGPNNSGRMAPEHPGAEAAPAGAALPGMLAPDISVPTMPQGAPPTPGTSIANATNTTGC
jgi:hypothetical protein